MRGEAVLVFDGVCNLCSRLVVFTIKRDPGGYFLFASLQSEKGKELLKKCRLSGEDVDTMLLVENDRCYTRSTAALRVFRRLKGLWKWWYGFIIIPGPLRDLVYRFIAGNRYRWFGKQDQCLIPSPGHEERFLDHEIRERDEK